MNSPWRFLLVMALSLVSSLATSPPEQLKRLQVEFAQVMSGHSFLRELDDRTITAIIWNQEGLRAFIEKYPIQIEGLNPVFDGKRVLIVAFSDRLSAAFCDGFSHVTQPESASYYIDLHDSGIEFKRKAPPEGKKYSSWVLVSIARADAISSVSVREPVAGGLSRQFGSP
jgi:hypothetical protein